MLYPDLQDENAVRIERVVTRCRNLPTPV